MAGSRLYFRLVREVLADDVRYADCRRFSYEDCHMLSFVLSRGPSTSYQDYHMFPIIIVRRYEAVMNDVVQVVHAHALKNRLLADPGTPGILRVCCRVCVSAE